LFPLDALARAYRHAGRANGGELLSYSGNPSGEPRLRAALARLLSETRNIVVDASDVLVTRGSQMAVHLIAQALIRPGDAVAVEELGYPAASQALRAAGAELLPIPIDEHGLDVGDLARRLERRAIRAVYITPHHHYPTTVTLAPDRRLELLELARRHRFAIIEDDYDQEFHFTGRPVLPMASIDSHGVVVYVGTIAKVLAPGLRLGYVVAPRRFLARMANARALIDRQGDWLVERAVAELFEDGEVQRHVRRMRRIYQARRDALVEALTRRLGSALSFHVPQGGMALWARVAPGIDVDAWQSRALAGRVMFQSGKSFTLDGSSRPCARFGYSLMNEGEIQTAVDRLVRAL
jgi:GntR family transcriptional regulator/MocR family aminotransferase